MSSTKSNEKMLSELGAIDEQNAKLDAIDLLVDDHRRVKKLFREFDKHSDRGEQAGKVEIALQICDALALHTVIEEDCFYPAAHAAIHDDRLVNEAEIEHISAKDLIRQIKNMDGSEELYNATVAVLREHIEHHIEQEELHMFPKARKSKIDMHALALAMLERRNDMTVELV